MPGSTQTCAERASINNCGNANIAQDCCVSCAAFIDQVFTPDEQCQSSEAGSSSTLLRVRTRTDTISGFAQALPHVPCPGVQSCFNLDQGYMRSVVFQQRYDGDYSTICSGVICLASSDPEAGTFSFFTFSAVDGLICGNGQVRVQCALLSHLWQRTGTSTVRVGHLKATTATFIRCVMAVCVVTSGASA